MAAFLELIALEKAYPETAARGGAAAVRSLDLAVQRGEFVTLLGPSGCGKTTTLRMVAGFIRPTGGEVRLNGRVLASAGAGAFVPPEARGMGMVFQSYAVWPHMNVLKNVTYPLTLRRIPRAEAVRQGRAMLDMVGLAGYETRYPNQLSGGQQQRVALARALISHPDVLLLDEPLSNLDAQLRESMRAELRLLHQQTGVTVLYVTHDQAEAMALSDRIVVMQAGQALQVGTPADVYHRPAARAVAAFIGAGNFLPCQIVSRDGERATVRLHLPDGAPRGGEAAAVIETQAARDSAGSIGQDALLLVRPEHLTLAPDADNARLRGQVRSAAFLGEMIDYSIDVGTLPLRARAVGIGPAYAAGDVVGLRIERSWLLPEAPPATLARTGIAAR
jgi:iron(III) transport system ATP-binding protein